MKKQNIPELMLKIKDYGSWSVSEIFRRNKFSQMEIKCSCRFCQIEKWKSLSEVLEERGCMNCKSINRKRNNYARKCNRINPIGNFNEKYLKKSRKRYKDI